MWNIDPRIERARTLPSRFYTDPAIFEESRRRIFRRSWHLAGDERDPGNVRPFALCGAPLLWTRDASGETRCLSNVCTHRANLLAREACDSRELRCRYHGRRFALDGRFLQMPEFEGTEGFPAAEDDLPVVPHGSWGPLLFCSLEPACAFDDWIGDARRSLSWLRPEALRFDSARFYDVKAHWALYVENYLEGFHVPFVHEGLNRVLDYGAYATDLHPWSVLQTGIAREGEASFDRPGGIAALYWWFFPNLMLNFYPWGLSVNIVHPVGPEACRVEYRTYVGDGEKRGKGAGGDLHSVEMEDEEVVEAVQAGVKSPLYERGRYSPKREAGVHHFHRLIDRAFC